MARNLMARSSPAGPDADFNGGSSWQPTEQEQAFAENFMEMSSLLGAVQGSIGRLETLGLALRKSVAASPGSAPAGVISLAAAAENLGQSSSHPSQMTDESYHLPQGFQAPGPAYATPNTPATSSSNVLDRMIFDNLQQLYPTLSHSNHEPQRPHDAQRQTAQEDRDAFFFDCNLMNRMPAELLPQQLGARQQMPYDDQRGSQQQTMAFLQEQMMQQQLGGGFSQLEDPSIGGYLSVGSAAHATNMCKPCVFLHNGMCLKGIKCQFCHMQHGPEQVKRVRPSKRTRNLLRQHRDTPGDGDDQNGE